MAIQVNQPAQQTSGQVNGIWGGTPGGCVRTPEYTKAEKTITKAFKKQFRPTRQSTLEFQKFTKLEADPGCVTIMGRIWKFELVANDMRARCIPPYTPEKVGEKTITGTYNEMNGHVSFDPQSNSGAGVAGL
jgi:hypothetical protein